ncbi:hypothetical protein LJR225_002056 [Phenylobacterium sp. LjRoot225]|uniref:hypothetical protein n=1 Tax=Phenylobacterium sp. LjRoot225 TaxID=3342285 RepID=UPI003ECC2BF5
MRTILILAAVSSCLGLAACQQSQSQATETAPAPKSLSRPAQLYAGQAVILSVDAASVAPGEADGGLTLKASGKTETAGYYELAFLPRINAAPPPDGVYDVDVIGYQPQGPAAQVVTPVEVSGQWTNYPKARLKGVRFNTKTNAVVAMLPTG